MAIPDAAVAYYAVQQALARRAASTAADVWSQMDPADLDGSWRHGRIGDRLFATVAAMQMTAAGPADDYLDEVLSEQDIDPQAAGRVAPRSLAGIASDGRPLETLLYESVIGTKAAIAAGDTVPEAMARGQARLVLLVATQIQDAARGSVSVGMAARPAVTGWVRMLVGPSCARCVVLAGKTYRWNRGFQRHPLCDCRHIPTDESVAGDLTVDPRRYFESLATDQQDRIFTRAGAEAIRDGADIGQVVNARRGMKTATAYGRRIKTTTEGTTVRGSAGRTLRRAGADIAKQQGDRYRRVTVPRLMPEQVFKDAKDRDDAVRLLKRFGYLT